MTVAFTSVRGLRLAYRTFGDRSAPPIVLLHGFMDHGLAFAPMIRALGRSFFAVVPDHRGHGDSGWIGDGGYYYFQDYFQDVLHLVDHLGLDRFGLVGHSMGGGIATGVAALIPDRVEAMVMIEGMGPPYQDPTDVLGRLHRWLDALKQPKMDLDQVERWLARPTIASREAAVERLMRANPRLPQAIAAELANTFTEGAPNGPEGAVVWKVDPLHRTPSPKPFLLQEIEPMWRALSMPVLSVYGTDSPWFPDDLAFRHTCLPDGRPVLVDGAGHNIHHERPELIADLVTRWMSGRRRDLPEGVRDGVLASSAAST